MRFFLFRRKAIGVRLHQQLVIGGENSKFHASKATFSTYEVTELLFLVSYPVTDYLTAMGKHKNL
jgi:hypothetical protein